MARLARLRHPDADCMDAWSVHRALLSAEAREPALRDNPRWKLLRMDAYEAFHTTFTEGPRHGH